MQLERRGLPARGATPALAERLATANAAERAAAAGAKASATDSSTLAALSTPRRRELHVNAAATAIQRRARGAMLVAARLRVVRAQRAEAAKAAAAAAAAGSSATATEAGASTDGVSSRSPPQQPEAVLQRARDRARFRVRGLGQVTALLILARRRGRAGAERRAATKLQARHAMSIQSETSWLQWGSRCKEMRVSLVRLQSRVRGRQARARAFSLVCARVADYHVDVRAVFDFASDREGDLSFAVGDLIRCDLWGLDAAKVRGGLSVENERARRTRAAWRMTARGANSRGRSAPRSTACPPLRAPLASGR